METSCAAVNHHIFIVLPVTYDVLPAQITVYWLSVAVNDQAAALNSVLTCMTQDKWLLVVLVLYESETPTEV